MNTVTSPDGTTIAYDQSGVGPPLILVGGAFNDRQTTAPLAAALAPHFTAVSYDRRGRGDRILDGGFHEIPPELPAPVPQSFFTS